MRSNRHRIECAAVVALALALSLGFLSGCATHAKRMCEPLALVSSGAYEQAAKALDKTDVARSRLDRFLYHAQRGHLLHLAGDYAGSNEAFEKAVRVGEALDPNSVTATLTDYTVNEAVKEYVGEDFERAYLHYYMALNYLMMDDLKEAYVEFDRMNTVFRRLDSRYEDDDRYQEDGFIRYLSGLVREAVGELDGAYIDYQKACDSYQGDLGMHTHLSTPDGLEDALACVSGRLGDDSHAAGSSVSGRDASKGEIVVIAETGWAPYKTEKSIEVPIAREVVTANGVKMASLAALVKIAYPEFVSVRSSCGSPRIRVASSGPIAATAEKVQDVDALARWILRRWIGAVKARSTFRATAKQVALVSQKIKYEKELRELRAKKTGNPITDFAVNAAISLAESALTKLVAETEQADTRSWVLLPAEVYVARIPVEPGEHEVWVEAGTGNGAYLTDITVGPGERVFRCCRIFGGRHPVRCDET